MVEGQTEETFVNRILAPELAAENVIADAHCITAGRRRGRLSRGGFVSYEHLATDLSRWMRQDQNEESWFTTMVDLFRLPPEFPGYAALPPNLPGRDRAELLEAELAKDLARRLDGLPVANRFIPYVQVHEFEALLFSDSAAFVAAFPDHQPLVTMLTAIRDQFEGPEDINDGPTTAPSKRILELAPDYDKEVAGQLIAMRIGLANIRAECPHFNDWIARLLALTAS